ncbi:hypothetical protein NDU88_002390 [Pleurodeles waltl]|uniref:Uncharacterized protein n=1 Tax=Pleurodeles waltl TaxID=8319 RepID=A0AAV7KU15_PLEWA|nr:hypothetical protein NDU88_002390 [Pleurodeles waltl]
MSASRAVRGKDRGPILGLRPHRVLTTARGRKKGPPRALRPLTRPVASPAARRCRGSPRGRYTAPRLPHRLRAIQTSWRSNVDKEALPRL